MGRKQKSSALWVLPGCILVLAAATLTGMLLQRGARDHQPGSVLQEGADQKMLPVSTTQSLLSTLAITNQTKSEEPEDRVVALVTTGNQFLEQGNYAEAAKKFEQAVAVAPDQEDLHYNLAIALAKLGKTEEAKKQYEEAIRIFPDYAEAHNNLGNLLVNENKLAEAIVQLREAAKSMPENASFRNNLGTAFGRSGNVAEAMGEFEEAIKQNPAFVEARVNLANAFLSTGRVEDAIAQLNEALRLRPDFKPALQTMQRARQRQASGKAQE